MEKPIAIFGKGRIGRAAAFMLREAGRLVQVYDVQDWTDETLDYHDVWLAATPFVVCEQLSLQALARKNKLYFDLTENVETGRAIRNAVGGSGGSIFVPHCGVAPGAVSIIAGSMGPARSITMRVGALPQNPVGRLKYALNWSTNGLVNEYLKPCPALVSGRKVELEPLMDCTQLEGSDVYEAFNTSGGIGTFCDTHVGMVDNAKYQTIRYLGHVDYIRFLFEDLGMSASEVEFLFDRALPRGGPDKVVISICCQPKTVDEPLTYSRCVLSGEHSQYPTLSAIQQTTAAGVVAVMLWVVDHPEEARALVRNGNWIANEDIPLTGVEEYACWNNVYNTSRNTER